MSPQDDEGEVSISRIVGPEDAESFKEAIQKIGDYLIGKRCSQKELATRAIAYLRASGHPSLREMTVEEVAKKFGIPAKTLRGATTAATNRIFGKRRV